MTNILTSFDEFAGNELLEARQDQDYRSRYLDIYQQWRIVDASDREAINDDLVFEIELIKQVEVNVDYILMLVQKHRDQFGDGNDKEIKESIARSIDASPSLRNKKDLIEAFIESVTITGSVDEQWKAFIEGRRDSELESIIEAENLNPEVTRSFIQEALRDGYVKSVGTTITKVLPPSSRFTPDGAHGAKKQKVLELLTEFIARYFGLV